MLFRSLSGKKWLEVPAALYVNTMRSIPLVMVILWFYLLIPFLVGRPIGAELSATITFIVFEAAYFSEIMRAGIQSIPRGQVFAGKQLRHGFAFANQVNPIGALTASDTRPWTDLDGNGLPLDAQCVGSGLAGVGVGLGMNGTTLDALPAESSDGGGVSIPDVYIVIDGEVRQADILTANGHRAI